MDTSLIDSVASRIKAVEARALPSGLTSTKFVAILAGVIICIVYFRDPHNIIDTVRWGVGLYVVQRLVEGGLHLICDTAVKIATILAVSKVPAQTTSGDKPA